MEYSLVISDERIWHKDVSKIPAHDFLKIAKRIQQLKTQPWQTGIDIKKLTNYGVADFRLRAGDYRVLFRKDDDRQQIRLLRVLHRSKLY